MWERLYPYVYSMSKTFEPWNGIAISGFYLLLLLSYCGVVMSHLTISLYKQFDGPNKEIVPAVLMSTDLK